MATQAVLEELHTQTPLSILTISHPILASLDPPSNDPKRLSNGSNASDQEARTPSAIQADLVHYQELFAKLRFSYVEQVTKERFLRAVTAETPEFVDGVENAELEAKLREDKANLKEKKAEVRGMIGDLEEQGRSLAQRYSQIQLRTIQLSNLPSTITDLETRIATLQQSAQPKSSNPDLNLSLQPTLSLLAKREQELAELDRQIASLQSSLPAKKRNIQALEDELGPLEMRKDAAVKSANEARRSKENGGVGDELEERGRWLRGVDSGLKAMLEV